MEGKMPQKRRKFFVKLWFQLRYMGLFAGSTVLGGLIFGLIVRAVVGKKISMEMFRPHSNIRNLWETLYPDVMRMPLVLFVSGVVVLFATHKVAGPLQNLGMSVREAREGRFPPPSGFRKGDQLAPLVQARVRLFGFLGSMEKGLENWPMR